MASKAARGKKLKCQNDDCALPFYDLNVEQPDCPTCGSAYDHNAKPEADKSSSTYRRGRQVPVHKIVAPEELFERAADGDDALETDKDEGAASILDIDDDSDEHRPGKEATPDEP